MEAEHTPLFEELVRHRFGGTVRVSDVAPLAGDASTRRYVRLRLEGTGAPATVIAMVLADRGIAMSSEELAVFKKAPQELPFINVHRFLAHLGVAVPEVYLDASDRGVVLLEDIGDVPLWDCVDGQPIERVRPLFQRAIDQLLLMQVVGTQQCDPSCIAFQQAFDERLFTWEFEHFIEYGIERRLGRSLPPAAAATMREHFTAIAHRLDQEPRYLNHRDFHCWNLFVQGDAIRVIDFQDALLAPLPYDLATLLGDRTTPQVVHRELEADLLAYYRDRWHALAGTELAEPGFTDTYFLCALQKALKVVGRFYFLEIEKHKHGYLRFIPSTVRQIKRILPRFPELAGLASLLQHYLPVVDECAP